MNTNEFEEASQSQWLQLILNAEKLTGYQLRHELKNYLSLTLQHYTSELTLPTSIIALSYMEALNLSGTKQSYELRNIGDQCLLLSGLFPERLSRKSISLDYTITIGRQSYSQLADKNHIEQWDSNLFYSLQDHFIGLVDILYTIRHTQ